MEASKIDSINGENSLMFDVLHGTVQGSVLGPDRYCMQYLLPQCMILKICQALQMTTTQSGGTLYYTQGRKTG